MTTTDIHAATLTPRQREDMLFLPHDALIELYNAESRRLAGSKEPHLVDASCKPRYIIGLFGFLARRYTDFEQEDNATTAQPISEQALKEAREAEIVREKQCRLNVGMAFNLMR